MVQWGKLDLLDTVLVEATYIRQRSVRQVQDAFEMSLRLCAKGDISPMLPELLLQHGARLQSIEWRKRVKLFDDASAWGYDTLDLMRKGLRPRDHATSPHSDQMTRSGSIPVTPRDRSPSEANAEAGTNDGQQKKEEERRHIDDFIETYLVVGFKLYQQLHDKQKDEERDEDDPAPRKDRDDLYFILWALACGAYGLAFMLWSQTAQPLRSALIAQGVCQKLERRFANEDQAGRVDKIRQARQQFQEAASEVLSRLHKDVPAAEMEGDGANDRRLTKGSKPPNKLRSTSVASSDKKRLLGSGRGDDVGIEILRKQRAQKTQEGKLLHLLYGEGGMDFDPTTVLGNKTIGNQIAKAVARGFPLAQDYHETQSKAAAQGLIALAIELKNKDFLSHRLVRTLLDDAWRGYLSWSTTTAVDKPRRSTGSPDSTAHDEKREEESKEESEKESEEWPGVYLASATETRAVFSGFLLALQMFPLLWPIELVEVDGPFVRKHRSFFPKGRCSRCFPRTICLFASIVVRCQTRWRMCWIPAVKFYVHFVAQLCFTFFTLVVTVFLDVGYGPIHPAQHVWFVWLLTLILQEVLEVIDDRFEEWLHKGFNGKLDAALLSMLTLVYVFRLSLADCDSVACLEEGHQQVMRTMLAFCWLMMAARPLEVLSIHPRIGKLVVIIRKMIFEFFIFLAPMACLTAGFMISFAILVPNYRLYEDAPYTSTWTKKSASNTGPWFGGPAAIPIWGLFGYFEPENISFSTHAVVLMPALFLVMYELFAVVLMLNLLIALFNDVYESMRDQWEGTASIILPTIIRDYSRTYPFPAPFNLLGRFWDFLVFLYVQPPGFVVAFTSSLKSEMKDGDEKPASDRKWARAEQLYRYQKRVKESGKAKESGKSQYVKGLQKEVKKLEQGVRKDRYSYSFQVPASHQRERARQAYQWQDGAEGGLAQIERAAHREYVEQLRDERARKTLI